MTPNYNPKIMGLFWKVYDFLLCSLLMVLRMEVGQEIDPKRVLRTFNFLLGMLVDGR